MSVEQDSKVSSEHDQSKNLTNLKRFDGPAGVQARLAALGVAVWAMLPEVLNALVAEAAAPDEPTEPESKIPRLPAVKGSVAVVPVVGVIGQRRDWWSDVGADTLGRQLDELMAAPSIGAVVLNIDSPGGSVYGVPELGEKIRGYRDAGKPIYAVANATAFSAAYWIGSQAKKLFVIPSGKVGSIGVWSAHVDVSKWEEDQGVKTTLVHAGKYKVEGHPWAPLDEEARAEMQRSVDHYYGMFLDAAAAGRGVKTSEVRDNYGQGRLIEAPRAVELGMVDGIATLDEVIAGLLKTDRDRQAAVEDLRMAEAEIGIREATFRGA